MQKSLGIVAIIIAVLSIFIPVAGPYLTIISALCAAFAYGGGFVLGIASIVLNLINVFMLSPSIWLTVAASNYAQSQGRSFLSVGSFLFFVQIGAGAVLYWLHIKNKAPASDAAINN
jgi:hypothetical protein